MVHVTEYCFAKEFANKNGDNNMDTTKKAIKKINDAMMKAEGAAETP